MKSPYVSELQPNQLITAVFVVQQKDIRQKKTGEPYLSMILGDRTGDIEAKMWDNVSDVMETFEQHDFLKVRGVLQIHLNRLQLTVHKLQKQDEQSIDVRDYFPASERSPDDMLAELRTVIGGVTNPHLRALLDAFFADEEIVARYKIAPAAKTVHHAYLGGLIEHVLSMCALARMTAAHYRNIDLDLLLAGVLLHDIGKVRELSYDRTFGYTTEGQLIGHIQIGLQLLNDKARAIEGFPPKLRMLIEHMILSHHGELEFGSPKVPLFPEALLLHHLDNLDSKMESMRASLERDRRLQGEWTTYNSALERTVLKKARFLDAPPPPGEVKPDDLKASATAAPAPPLPAAKPSPVSAFAEKLAGALRKE